MGDQIQSPSQQERIRLINLAREKWIGRLMDPTRRNNLLYFRDLSSGSLRLDGNDSNLVSKFFDGQSISFTQSGEDADARKQALRLKTIARKAQSNLAEKGLATLFLAFGMATWPTDDSGRPPSAAVVLLPLEIEISKMDRQSINVKSAGPPQCNIALLHALEEIFNCAITPEELIESGVKDKDNFDPVLVLEKLRQRAKNISGFEVNQEAVIGNFSFQKLAMVKDLKDSLGLLTNLDLIAALAGDSEARAKFSQSRTLIEPSELDKISPESEYAVLDADSSQQAVIHAVSNNMDGVIQGPPGCGKSQTIANVITTLVAEGKKVLFVAEKRAALEAVSKRLHQNDLGHLALDLHGATVSQRSIMQTVSDNLDVIKSTTLPNTNSIHRKFEQRREILSNYDSALHTAPLWSFMTPFQLMSSLIETRKSVQSHTRWPEGVLTPISREIFEDVLDLLKEGRGVESLLQKSSSSPWADSEIPNGETAAEAISIVDQLNSELLPKLEAEWEPVVIKESLTLPNSIAQMSEYLEVIGECNSIFEKWSPQIFTHPELSVDLSPATKGTFKATTASLFDSKYKRAKLRSQELRIGSPCTLLESFESAKDSQEILAKWRSIAPPDSFPTRHIDVTELSLLLNSVITGIEKLKKLFPKLEDPTFAVFKKAIHSLAEDKVTPFQIPIVRRIESKFRKLKLERLLAEIQQSRVEGHSWENLLRDAYAASCLDIVRAKTRELSEFIGSTHTQNVTDFQELDRQRLGLAAKRVIRAHAERATNAMNQFPEQTSLIKRESRKKSRLVPLRQLLKQAPDVLTSICPCWMSSPLNVSQLIPLESGVFDVVIFDEASQVPPEDAICSILRGNQLVIAGDPHQLPPTTFFADGGNSDESDSDEQMDETAGFESLLDNVSAFMDHWPLNWHYRSRDERLITFSNRHIYGNRLVTFPGTGQDIAVEHIQVDPPSRDGEERSSSLEVEKVVELVLNHAERQMQKVESERESLGVIAFGINHANRIQAAIDAALQYKSDLSSFLETSVSNPWFFIKNLERVQGDERDVIILSVGYSKSANGTLPYRFGPLLQEGGERRLNVAITRAMQRMIVVSSFNHLDMDPNRSSKQGVRLLRLFLQFASTNGANLGDIEGTGEPMNPFESDIYDVLTTRGLNLVPQYGVAGYRLDFAVTHPERKGQYILAIECNGASYHSSPTARDRDRLRQQVLEGIGWRFHRIWSTDWFNHREQEIDKVLRAWQNASATIPISEDKQNSAIQPVVEPPPPQRSSPRPPAISYESQFPILIRWILSDGLLRTDDEIISEALPLVGYSRRGTRITAALKRAISTVRNNH